MKRQSLMFTLLMLLMSLQSEANISAKYGFGVSKSALSNPVEVKTASLSAQFNLTEVLITQIELGGWTDTRKDIGRKGAFFGNTGLGLNVDAQNIYAQVVMAVAGLSEKDSYLGGYFQFSQDLAVGVKDKNGYALGVNYKHMSSAGIFMPNQGRDFMYIRVTIPW